jgi:hypothetical protein
MLLYNFFEVISDKKNPGNKQGYLFWKFEEKSFCTKSPKNSTKSPKNSRNKYNLTKNGNDCSGKAEN